MKGALQLIKEWPPEKILVELDFTTAAFLIQITGLPLNKMDLEYVEVCGRGLGVSEDIVPNSAPSPRMHTPLGVRVRLYEPWIKAESHLSVKFWNPQESCIVN